MSYNYCKDHRSGITYVYEISRQLDDNGKWHSDRKLIGRLDDEGNVVPTSGRKGRLPKNKEVNFSDGMDEACRKQIEMLSKQVAELQKTVESLRKEKQLLVDGMHSLLKKVM